MTIQELKDLVRLKIAGQGTMVDAGGALPPVLNGILDTLAATQNVESVVVTVDGGEGTPSADATFADGVLTLAFHNLKGEKGDQGNTGSSVDYPFELVNNVTTDDATKALSAAQGVVLDGKISQLGQDVTNLGNTLQNEIDNITPTVIEGDVTNAPDQEDITTDSNNLLKFKNRVAGVGEMGYKILRKGISFATQVTDTNTIYEIRYPFDLGGASITIPAGCILKFNGGKVTNGTLTGEVLNPYLRPEWFGAKGDGVSDDTAAIQNCLNLCAACRFEKEYKTTYLSLGKSSTLYSLSGEAIIHFNRIECVSTNSISMDGSRFSNLIFDGDMACDGLLIKANNITIEGCTFKNIKGTGNYYGGLTAAIYGGDYYSLTGEIEYSNITIDNCVFDTCEPVNENTASASNTTVARFVSLHNFHDARINNCIFKNLIGLQDSDCIQIQGNEIAATSFPFAGSGNWSGSSPAYPNTIYKHYSTSICNNSFYLHDTKSAIKVMVSGVSIVGNSITVVHDNLSPLGAVPQYAVIRGHRVQDLEIINNQIGLKNVKQIDGVFTLGFVANGIISNNIVSKVEGDYDIENLSIYKFETCQNIKAFNDTVQLTVSNNCGLAVLESNGEILFQGITFDINYASETETEKELCPFTPHYIYPDQNTKGQILLRECDFSFAGVFQSISFSCSTEKSFYFDGCKFDANGKLLTLSISSILDRTDVRNILDGLSGTALIRVISGRSDIIPGSLAANGGDISIRKVETLCYVSCGLSASLTDCKFVNKVDNHLIRLFNGITIQLDRVALYPGVVQLRNENGNNICSIKDVTIDGGWGINTYTPAGTLTLNYRLGTSSADGITYGATASRTALGSNVEKGYIFYDTSLNKPLFWNGSAWINMDGTAL